MANKTYYITTPIYYPSGKWHLGHSYTTVICDALARYKKLRGYDVFYLTGTDEHGKKIEENASKAGVSEMQFIDGLVEEIKQLWKVLDIEYDGFLRTTDPKHEAAVGRIFTKLYEQGDIYKSKYEGLYCTPCESFWTKTQAKEKDGKKVCPDCGREVHPSDEECYFFRLSKYEARLRKLLTETDFLEPKSRVNEMVNNFIDAGLSDLAVSRKTIKWGIPVPFDKEQVVYVWIDALSNYITALGAFSEDDSQFKKYWPADLQVVGKEIVRFHSIIWPAILMALDIPLPKKLFGHGWLLFDGGKMSKSFGNIVDPFVLCERYGSDSVRYYLLREVTFGADALYSNELFLRRINSDLTNDLSNLVNRTLAMAEQYFGGSIKCEGEVDQIDDELVGLTNSLLQRVDLAIDKIDTNSALDHIFSLISKSNKYIDLTAPWILAKDENKKGRLNRVIFNLLEAIRVASVLLTPFIPNSAQSILAQLNIEKKDWLILQNGGVKKYEVKKGAPVFMRFDIKKELAFLSGDSDQQAKKEDKQQKKEGKKMEEKVEQNTEITIDDFFKVELKTARVTACEPVPKADKLLKLTLECGEDSPRTVVSGIAKCYTPEQMVGKTVVLVANLKPAKLRGVESQGMILCASDEEGNIVVVSPESLIKEGMRVS